VVTRVVAITGALGYVGGRVSKHLAENTADYLRLGCRQIAGHPEWLVNGEIVPYDLQDAASLDRFCRGADTVIHLAAANENVCAADPELALRVNVSGALHLLRSAIRAGVKRFLYFSTAHVYGSPLLGLIDEQSLPRPAHPYSISHRVTEDFVLAAHDKGELLGIVVRLSNGFGVPERASVDRWTLIVNDLCRQAVVSRKLVMRSSGLDERNFVTLHDVGRAVVHLLGLPKEQLGNGLFNLASERSMRVIDLVELIAGRTEQVLGFRPVIERPDATGVALHMPLDLLIEKLKKTGFDLRGDMADEIDATLRLCRDAFAMH
jgi:UDP-glucose 4-epimerase